MNLKELLSDDRAVSPVIGVILMVAITVILAAVIGTFVLGLGDQVSQTTPNASFGFDYDQGTNDSLSITHNGGDTIDSSELNVSLSGVTQDDQEDLNGQYTWSELGGSSGDVSAGGGATVNADNLKTANNNVNVTAVDLSAATTRIVWQAAEGDSSAQVGRWDGPDA